MWGSYGDRRSVSSTKTDALGANRWEAEGRILCEPTRAGVPHLSGFIFESLAAQAAMKLLKIVQKI